MSIVDQLGMKLALAANIKAEVQALKDELVAQADTSKKTTAFDGEMFRATVTFGSKKTTDYRAILEELVCRGAVSQDTIDNLLISYTAVAEGVPTVKCGARKA